MGTNHLTTSEMEYIKRLTFQALVISANDGRMPDRVTFINGENFAIIRFGMETDKHIQRTIERRDIQLGGRHGLKLIVRDMLWQLWNA